MLLGECVDFAMCILAESQSEEFAWVGSPLMSMATRSVVGVVLWMWWPAPELTTMVSCDVGVARPLYSYLANSSTRPWNHLFSCVAAIDVRFSAWLSDSGDSWPLWQKCNNILNITGLNLLIYLHKHLGFKEFKTISVDQVTGVFHTRNNMQDEVFELLGQSRNELIHLVGFRWGKPNAINNMITDKKEV